ncbi:MAG: S41 family peptidase [Bacteroidales bacterium]
MNKFIKPVIITIVILIAFIDPIVVLGQSNNFEISKNLDIYATLFKEINTNYVDEVNPGELMEIGIDAMLKSLDPYTVFIPEAEVEDYKFITTGQYGGIGALIHKDGEYVVITEPYEDNPAQLSGLKAGDRVIEVDGNPLTGKSTSDVSSILKGQAGTTVNIVIERDGVDTPISKDIVRENVKIKNIPYYGMVGGGIGYIKLAGFTQQAGKEVKEAFLELKDNNELKGFILDLRGNGGGLLQEAVNITNVFVDKGQFVVSTKGKLATKNNSYKTNNIAVDTEIPLVVLIDNSSASASEIVAGALQDLDRAVIIGERSFGKGLVQNVIPISYNSQAKITVAKYYIPSGRCIQAIDYSKKDENGNGETTPDSLSIAFKTMNGRTVYDGHGIEPDIKIEPAELSMLSYTLLTKFLFFNFATKFDREHASILPADQFVVTDEIYNSFVSYLADKDYSYTTKSEQSLEDLKEDAVAEKYFSDIEAEYDNLLLKMKERKADDIEMHKEEIKQILRLEIISRYYYQTGKIVSSLKDDKDLKKAIEILNANDEYVAILDGTASGK